MNDYLTKQDIERVAEYIVEKIQKPPAPVISAEPGTLTCFCGQTTHIHDDICDHGLFGRFLCQCGRQWNFFWMQREEAEK